MLYFIPSLISLFQLPHCCQLSEKRSNLYLKKTDRANNYDIYISYYNMDGNRFDSNKGCTIANNKHKLINILHIEPCVSQPI